MKLFVINGFNNLKKTLLAMPIHRQDAETAEATQRETESKERIKMWG